jgi:hypothetical protein
MQEDGRGDSENSNGQEHNRNHVQSAVAVSGMQDVHGAEETATAGGRNNCDGDEKSTQNKACHGRCCETLGTAGTLDVFDRLATLGPLPAEADHGRCAAKHGGRQEKDGQVPRPKVHTMVRPEAGKVLRHVYVAVVLDHDDGGDCEEKARKTAEHERNCLWTTSCALPSHGVTRWTLQLYYGFNHNSEGHRRRARLLLGRKGGGLDLGWLRRRPNVQDLRRGAELCR